MTDNQLLNIVNTVADLKLKVPFTDARVLLIAKSVLGDNLGGFYYWDSSSTIAEDAQFMNVISSSVIFTGRWIRVFQKAQVVPQGYLTNFGGVKTLYVPGSIVAGASSTYTTYDATLGGTPIFTEIWAADGFVNSTPANANATVIANAKWANTSPNLVTFSYSQGNSTTLGSTLLSIVGLVIPGLRTAMDGVPVVMKIEGI